MATDMLILVGLGNPGSKYARHRHNVGFMAVDALAEAQGFGPARRKFHAELREGALSGRKTVILKPQTYMNDSGLSVGEAARFYKVPPENIIVFHDELDLAPGKVKAKLGGGVAGHNGLRSIAAHIGPDFRRVRIGIGHPGDKTRVTGHVLGDFAKADEDWLTPLLAAMAASAPALVEGDAKFTSALALRLQGPRSKERPAQKDKTDRQDRTPQGSATPERPSAEGPLADFLRGLSGDGEKN